MSSRVARRTAYFRDNACFTSRMREIKLAERYAQSFEDAEMSMRAWWIIEGQYISALTKRSLQK